VGALADASAKLEELSSEIAQLDFSEEKEDAQRFLGALSVAVSNLNNAFQSLIKVVQSAGNGGDEPAPPAAE